MGNQNGGSFKLLERALTELGSPIRLWILAELERDGPASPKELADAIPKGDLGVTAYHVRKMLDQGLLELTGETRVRGAVQHFYRLTRRGKRLHTQLLGGGK